MREQTLIALTLATMMALLGFASSVTAVGADDVIEAVADEISNDKPKEHKDEDGKHVYVALGTIGGVVVSCPGINPIDYVEVGVLGDTVATVDFYDSEDETGSGDVNVPVETGVNSDGRLCLGGAADDMPDTTPTATTSAWDVWIKDLVWDRVLEDELLADDVFQVAGFARMDIQYDYAELEKGDEGTGEEQCVPVDDDGETPVVCDQPGVGVWTATQAINNFGFCGQGVISSEDGDYRDPWAVIDTDENIPGETEDRTNPSVTKVVFVDGIDTFLLDCAQGGEEIEGSYNIVVGLINQVTCSDQQNPDLLPLVPSLVCFFDLPVGGSQCLDPIEDLTEIPVPGLIGTIGWRHVDSTKCHEQAFDQDVNDFQPAALDIKNEPEPEIPGCEAAGDLEENCDEAIATLNLVLGAVEILIVIEAED